MMMNGWKLFFMSFSLHAAMCSLCVRWWRLCLWASPNWMTSTKPWICLRIYLKTGSFEWFFAQKFCLWWCFPHACFAERFSKWFRTFLAKTTLLLHSNDWKTILILYRTSKFYKKIVFRLMLPLQIYYLYHLTNLHEILNVRNQINPVNQYLMHL